MKNKVFLTIFATLFAALSLLTLLLPKREFSPNENRMLASFHAPDGKTLADGSFMKDLSEYLSDHFVGRDLWVSVNTLTALASGKRENNGVYLTKGGALLDGFAEEDAKMFDKNVSAVKDFGAALAEQGIPLTVIVAPTATQLYPERLPSTAVVKDAAPLFAQLAGVPGFVDTAPALTAERDAELYYHTDHHWTGYGAYVAYAALRTARGEQPRPYEDYMPQTVTDHFFGTLYSRFGLFAGMQPDTIVTPSAEALGTVTMTDSKGNARDSIYAPEKLAEKDKYLYFLGGNDSVVVITAQNGTGRRLLLVKDSYANAFLPYLLPDYDAITVIDPRYYPGSVLKLAAEGEYTEVMVLYNLKSFASDSYVQFLPLAD
ncbi:MAG: hypothetical protein IJK89_01120 [Clostridia bacterium]|nr:hypothetical protein [Clostridia bacterium]